MSPLELGLFLGLNAGPDTPSLVVDLARAASQGETPGMLVLLAFGAATARRQPRHVLLASLTALLLAWCAVRGLRLWVPFPRPAQLGLGIQWVVQGPRPGFPSMHTATAFALAGALALTARRPVAWAALVLAAAVAWSRVCLGLHFPSDILAGFLVGLWSTAMAGLLLPHQLKGLGRSSAYWFHPARPWARRR